MLASLLFFIVFRMMPGETKEDLTKSVYISFRTQRSVFNLWRTLVWTKAIEELILKLHFSDNCALLAHTEEVLQAMVDHVAKARLFGQTISLKKAEALHQSSTHAMYSPSQITLNGHPLISVEKFTYVKECNIQWRHDDKRGWRPCRQSQQLLWSLPAQQSVAQSLASPLEQSQSLPGICHQQCFACSGNIAAVHGRTKSPTSSFQRELDCQAWRLSTNCTVQLIWLS